MIVVLLHFFRMQSACTCIINALFCSRTVRDYNSIMDPHSQENIFCVFVQKK